MRVVWSPQALDDVKRSVRYIAAENPYAAGRVAKAIRAAGRRLSEFATGHVGRYVDTYEQLVPRYPYTLVYRITDENVIFILNVIHQAQDRPLADG